MTIVSERVGAEICKNQFHLDCVFAIERRRVMPVLNRVGNFAI